MKKNNSRRQKPASIVGKSTFVLDSKEQKQALTEKQEEPVTDSSGKMDIEVPLDYEPENCFMKMRIRIGWSG